MNSFDYYNYLGIKWINKILKLKLLIRCDSCFFFQNKLYVI